MSTSFGPSGEQSRAVEAGLQADVVSFSIEPDITRLVKAGLVTDDWNATPTKGRVTTSVVSFIVRPGNPKNIKTWDDLLKPGVEVITPNPFTSGAAKWNLLAAYGQASNGGKDKAAGLAYVKELLTKHVKVQDKSGREALQNFTSGNGDVLLSYEHFRSKMVAGLTDEIALKPFWRWFEQQSEGERQQAIAPVMNKLRAFLLRPRMRGVIGQGEAKFNIEDVFTKRRIVLVSLAKGLLGPEAAALLGSLIVSQLWQAALGRVRIAPERRHPVMVYVDEFQDYLHLPTDLTDVLTVGSMLANFHAYPETLELNLQGVTACERMRLDRKALPRLVERFAALAEIEQAVGGAALPHLVIEAGKGDVVRLAGRAGLLVYATLGHEENGDALAAGRAARDFGEHHVDDVFGKIVHSR